MKVEAHLIAETAQFDSDGFFTIIRGGLTGVKSSGFPFPYKFSILTRLLLTEKEASKLVVLNSIISFEGREIATVDQPLAVKVTNPNQIFVNAIGNIQLLIDAPGKLTVRSYVLGSALNPLDLLIEAAG